MDDTTRPDLDVPPADTPAHPPADVVVRLERIEAQIAAVARTLQFVTTVLTVIGSKYGPVRKAIEVAAEHLKD